MVCAWAPRRWLTCKLNKLASLPILIFGTWAPRRWLTCLVLCTNLIQTLESMCLVVATPEVGGWWESFWARHVGSELFQSIINSKFWWFYPGHSGFHQLYFLHLFFHYDFLSLNLRNTFFIFSNANLCVSLPYFVARILLPLS